MSVAGKGPLACLRSIRFGTEMAIKSDILIIGGGIAGVGAAARASIGASVTLLEAEASRGYHATGRSAAIFIRNYGNATLRALNAASETEFKEPEGISDRSLLSPRGEMLLATEDEVQDLENYLAGATGMDRLTPAEAKELVPILRTDQLVSAAIERGAQEIDVDRLLQGYFRLAVRNGVQVFRSSPAQSITHANGLWHVTTPNDHFQAPVLVNAAGAWADEIAVLAGVAPLGLQPKRRSAALIPAPDGYDIGQWPLFASASEAFYAKPDAGLLMVSPADEDLMDPHDAWPDDMVLAEGLHRFEQAVTVPVTRLEHSWAGLRTFAPDDTPVVGFDANTDGFFWLAGQGGFGVQTAPSLSALSAALLLGEAAGLRDEVVTALDPQRFHPTSEEEK